VQTAHPQDLSSMAVLQPQKIIHGSFPLVAYALRKQVLTNLITGPQTGSYRSQR
jgi:hypothetical protein